MTAANKILSEPQVPAPLLPEQPSPPATPTPRDDDRWTYDVRRHPSYAWRLA